MRVVGALLAVVLAHGQVSGQVNPDRRINISGYSTGSYCHVLDAPGLVTIYIVYEGLELSSISFTARVPQCAGLIYLGDETPFPATTGDSQMGVTVSLGECRGTFMHLLTVQYAGSGYTPPCCLYPITAGPGSSGVGGVDCAGHAVAVAPICGYINGTPSCDCTILGPIYEVCDVTPTTPTTWGQIKAAYMNN